MWSGFPLTVTSGVDNARTGTGNQRATSSAIHTVTDRSQPRRPDQ